MSILNPTLPVIGDLRGTGETAVHDDLTALLADYNGNIDLTNILTPLLYLAAGSDRKVNVGVASTGSFGGGSRVVGSIAHGLGSTPTIVVLHGGHIATFDGGAGTIEPTNVSYTGLDATNISFVATIVDRRANTNPQSGNAAAILWVAIA